jgi:hypothetical protein
LLETIDKTIERVRQLLFELTTAGIPTQVSKAAGVNGVTLWQIKKGGQATVSERVFDSIWDFWSRNMRRPAASRLMAS